MKEFYIDISGDLLTDMRLIIEGAVNIYESDAAPLLRLAMKNNMTTAANAFNTIGSAIYDLLYYIRDFQEAYMREVLRKPDDK